MEAFQYMLVCFVKSFVPKKLYLLYLYHNVCQFLFFLLFKVIDDSTVILDHNYTGQDNDQVSREHEVEQVHFNFFTN